MDSCAPDYRRIYLDIVNIKFPEKLEEVNSLLSKPKLSVLDVIELNQKIFGKSKSVFIFSQKNKSYDTSTILEILNYQKKYTLNNSQAARHFNLSRNTIAKWKNIFH